MGGWTPDGIGSFLFLFQHVKLPYTHSYSLSVLTWFYPVWKVLGPVEVTGP